MRERVVGLASALTLLAGAAIAQETPTTTTPGMPGAAEEAPAASGQDMAPPAAGDEVTVREMVGRNVIGADGQPLGKVADVVVDPETGQMSRLVIESGGFLGIGAKTVAVDLAEADIRPEEGIFLSSMTQADIETMPEFRAEEETKSLDAPPEAAPAAGTSPTTAPAPGQ